jgi:hypothetical protein
MNALDGTADVAIWKLHVQAMVKKEQLNIQLEGATYLYPVLCP